MNDRIARRTLGSLYSVAVELVSLYGERGTHNTINADIINAHQAACLGLAGERITAAQSRQIYLAWEALRWQNHNHAAAQAADQELLQQIYPCRCGSCTDCAGDMDTSSSRYAGF